MSKGKYILVNGSFIPAEEYRVDLSETESIHFSEKFRAVKSALPFFAPTLELIQLKLLLFNQSFPEFTENEGMGLRRQLERTLTKNKHFQGAKLTLTFRFSENKTHYTIHSETTENIGYQLNEKGLFVDIFGKIQKPVSQLTTLSLGSSAYWDIARRYQDKSNADEYLLINANESVIEFPESNIYLIVGQKVIGASESDGAYLDVTKPIMLDIFDALNLEYTEDEEITPDTLRAADEIMKVNAIDGIQWVIGWGEKRFFNQKIRKINEWFNKLVLS